VHAPVSPAADPAPVGLSAGGELRALLRLAGPLVGANLLQMAVYAVDVVFVARLGTVELAAATLGVYLYSVIMFSLGGLVGAAAPVIAAELGRRRHSVREVRRTFRMSLWLAAATCLPFMVLLANGEWLLLSTGQDARVAARADAFLDILLWALLPSVAATAMRNAVSALGRPGWAFAVTAMALGVSLFANWLLVFGRWGVPALGLEGSALASLSTSVAMMLAYAGILLLDRSLRRWHLFGRWWRSEWSRLSEIARLGAPIALTLFFEAGLFSAAGFLMGVFGVTEVAAHAVALQVAALAFQVPFGVAQAATIRVGLFFGARDAKGAGQAGWVALALGTGFMAFTAVLLWTMPGPFVRLYLDGEAPGSAAAAVLAVQYLAIAAAFQLFDGAQAVAAGVLRGLQDTRVPMLIALAGYWVAGFGVAVLLGFDLDGWGFGWRGTGVWIGLAVGLAAVAALLTWRWSVRERLQLVPRTA